MKTAIIFGSSGLIGNELFKTIILNNSYEKIKVFVRSIPEINNPKVEIIKTDFTNLKQYKDKIKGDECFFCIGTTKKDTPNKDEYRRIEYNIPIDVAKIAKENSVNTFFYISSIGANPNASSNYLKNKGQVEEELKNLNFPRLAIIRPSLLVGNRKSFRLGEVIFTPIMNTLTFFAFGSLKKYKPIKIKNVVKSIIYISKNESNKTVFESDELEEIAKSN
ncbi:MAG: segregation protein B [Candidatus Pelagibacter sp.]|nr:segregation protein B [Candidatus Pelagibacter sp.]|tara:strand:- start:870 stop:1529 length:660 start_codon:yes stop_codon:yes gene_type:complete